MLEVAHTQDRSVCHQVQQDITPVCGPRLVSLGSVRSEPIMGRHARICLSSNSSDSKCHKQEPQPQLSQDYSHSSGLAQHVMVLLSSEPVIPDSPLPTLKTQPSNSTIQWEPAQGPSQSEFPCLAPRASTIRVKGFSGQVTTN